MSRDNALVSGWLRSVRWVQRYVMEEFLVEHQTPKAVVVSKAAVRRAGARATKASAKLEGRVVPAGHKRSAAVAAYIAKRQLPKR